MTVSRTALCFRWGASRAGGENLVRETVESRHQESGRPVEAGLLEGVKFEMKFAVELGNIQLGGSFRSDSGSGLARSRK